MIQHKRLHVPSSVMLRNPDIFDSDELVRSESPKKKISKRWKDTRRRLATGARLHVSIWRRGVEKLGSVISWMLFSRNKEKLERRPPVQAKEILKQRWGGSRR